MAVKDDAADGNRQLNYAKIKADLASSSVHYRTRGLLLQGLRWVNIVIWTEMIPFSRVDVIYFSCLACCSKGAYSFEIFLSQVFDADYEQYLMENMCDVLMTETDEDATSWT